MNRLRWTPLLISLITILASTAILYLLLWDGGVRLSPDSRWYLAAGINLHQGNGLILPYYDAAADTVILRPLVHYPPLPSILYSFLMFLGVSPLNVPTVVSLLAWVLLLSGIGLLTYRLSKSQVIATFAIILAAITYPYLVVFEYAWSEVIFLPLVLFLMVTLVDLPKRERGTIFCLVIAAVILALLMLTRYIGVFVFASVLAWWCWWRVSQRQTRKLVVESAILSVAALPLLAWIARNALLTGRPLGEHLGPSRYTFADGLIRAAHESASVVLPATRPAHVWHILGWAGLLVYLVPFVVGGYLLWRYKPERRQITDPTRTPLPVFLAVYFALFTVAQPFFSFWPMDQRFMAVALCLIQPWLLSMLVRAPRHWSNKFLFGYVALNLILIVVPLTRKGIPDWIAVNPPGFRDLADRHPDVVEYSYAGIPEWLMVTPPRTRDLANHHRDLIEFLQPFDGEVSIVTNERLLFYPYQLGTVGYLTTWLSHGACTPRHDVVIVIIDWDRWAEEADNLQHKVEQKCPGVSKAVLSHSVVYHLRQ